ncbi:MAG: A/G-specific adenine glycosylase [Verrucomicrobia bacterium]|jgi:A/G-specific adenine glycosylase|nr:MAG: A/G-specific adenine glycosylase [Verrucomicrobiota bacterium]
MEVHAPQTTNHAASKLVPLLLDWFAANARDLPWRRTRDPYAIWVSEIMLQQTQVKTVIPYWERWMSELPTIEALATASASKIHKMWEGLGYYTRVRNLQRAAQQIVWQHVGKFPKKFEDILALPGIGRYTAGAVSSIAFNQPRPIVDGNVIRVISRVFGITTDPREKKTNAQLWVLAEDLVLHAARTARHASPCSHLNQSLMELGALVCTPRSPKCDVCPINKLCVSQKEGLQEQIPNLSKREAATARRFIAFVVQRDGKYLVRQRPASVVNAHLWEFPNIEATTARQKSAAPFEVFSAKPLCTIKHSITRYRITLEAWRAKLDEASSKNSGRWLNLSQLRKLAFASAHKKVLAHL